MPLTPGTSVGPYEIVARLGAGGMGEVFRARDSRLNRPVAIKLLAPDLGTDTARRRFQREVETTSSLNHPHIVTVYDVGEFEGRVYLVTELVDGGTLKDWADAARRSPLEIAELAAGVADGLAAAHAAGIIHRDIKPGNILVAKNGYAKVADFGLAKLVEQAPGDDAPTRDLGPTLPGLIVGTVAYMSPEQASRRAVDARSDVFSLGVVLYERLAGRRPFGGANDLEVLQTVISGTPPPLPEEVPPALRTIVEKALEKNPAERYQSAGDLAVDLRRVARPASVATGPIAAGTQPSRTVAWIAAAALIVLLAGATGWWMSRGSTPASDLPSQIRSIAVLPLDNLSGDPAQDYLSEGATEELIAALAQVRQLRVISRTSMMRYKGTTKGMAEIGRELGVDGIVEGSLRRADGRVRVTAQLIHAATDTHVWANTFDHDAADVLKLQAELARAIVGEIRVALTPEESSRLADAKAVNPMAWDETLLGHAARWKGGPENVQQAIAHYERALELQADYAPAHAGLAMALSDRNRPEDTARARAAAMRAVEFDPDLAESYAAMGYTSGWDWQGSERDLRLALSINPNSLDACGCFVVQLSASGRFAEAIPLAERMIQTNPVVAVSFRTYGVVLYHARRFDDAVRMLERALERDPAEQIARLLLSQAYQAAGKPQESLAVLDRPEFRDSGPLGLAQAVAGNRAEALRIARVVGDSDAPSRRRAVAMIYFALGDADSGFEWLTKSIDAREGQAFLLIESPFDSVRSDPRFATQLARLNFPPEAVANIRQIR